MFGIFKRKSKVEKLQLKYKKLLEEAHKHSKVNRKLSDRKMFEANEILDQIDQLNKSE
ncbi:MAG: Lacal_2735 family protein [Flavobacteriales bacterium]|nr:Lacal_2735 family protein [Flavobacteriales bacterium]